MHIPLNRSTIGEEEKAEAKAVLDSDRLTMGEQCRAFEREFASHIGVEHAVMVNSGSSANLIALFAMADTFAASDPAPRVPKAVRFALLVNPTNPASAEPTLRGVAEAARAIGLQIQVLNASTSREIEAAFATIVRERADALFVGADGFFNARRVQFATLATRYGIPAAYGTRETVEAGGLMSYGTDILDMYRQVGVYSARILKGASPADPPVVQSTKFELVINLQTARALGLEVFNSMQLLADEMID